MVTTLFTEEHDALREAVRRWVERDAAAHAAAWEQAGGWPRELLNQVAEQGWLAAALAPDAGGDVLASIVVAEELGRLRSAGATHDLLTQAHATALLTQAGGDAWASQAKAAAQGELALCGIGGPALTLTPDGDGWLLNGHNPAVTNAQFAGLAVAVVPETTGLTLLAVDTTDPGWSTSPAHNPYGRRGSRAADIHCNNVRIAASQILLQGADAAALMQQRQTRYRLDHAAATVAAAWLTWHDAREYALQREAFGRPIGTFQVNRHALADMAAELTAARSLVYDVAHKTLTGTVGPGETAAMRLYADEVTLAAADKCLQLHGGYGYTMEFDVQRAWRDAAHLRHDEGGHGFLIDDISQALVAAVTGDRRG